MAVNINITLSCDVTPCILTPSYQPVGGNWPCPLRGTSTLNLKEKPSFGTVGTTGVKIGPIHWTVGVNIPQEDSLGGFVSSQLNTEKNDVSKYLNDAFKYPVNLKTTVKIIYTSYIYKQWNI